MPDYLCLVVVAHRHVGGSSRHEHSHDPHHRKFVFSIND